MVTLDEVIHIASKFDDVCLRILDGRVVFIKAKDPSLREFSIMQTLCSQFELKNNNVSFINDRQCITMWSDHSSHDILIRRKNNKMTIDIRGSGTFSVGEEFIASTTATLESQRPHSSIDEHVSRTAEGRLFIS